MAGVKEKFCTSYMLKTARHILFRLLHKTETTSDKLSSTLMKQNQEALYVLGCANGEVLREEVGQCD